MNQTGCILDCLLKNHICEIYEKLLNSYPTKDQGKPNWKTKEETEFYLLASLLGLTCNLNLKFCNFNRCCSLAWNSIQQSNSVIPSMSLSPYNRVCIYLQVYQRDLLTLVSCQNNVNFVTLLIWINISLSFCLQPSSLFLTKVENIFSSIFFLYFFQPAQWMQVSYKSKSRMGKTPGWALSSGSCYINIQRFFSDRNIKLLQN